MVGGSIYYHTHGQQTNFLLSLLAGNWPVKWYNNIVSVCRSNLIKLPETTTPSRLQWARNRLLPWQSASQLLAVTVSHTVISFCKLLAKRLAGWSCGWLDDWQMMKMQWYINESITTMTTTSTLHSNEPKLIYLATTSGGVLLNRHLWDYATGCCALLVSSINRTMFARNMSRHYCCWCRVRERKSKQ